MWEGRGPGDHGAGASGGDSVIVATSRSRGSGRAAALVNGSARDEAAGADGDAAADVNHHARRNAAGSIGRCHERDTATPSLIVRTSGVPRACSSAVPRTGALDANLPPGSVKFMEQGGGDAVGRPDRSRLSAVRLLILAMVGLRADLPDAANGR